MKKKKGKKIGILNKGKRNTFIDNRFEGHDVGIQYEGEGTLARGNEFRGSDNSKPEEEVVKLSPEFYGVGVNLKSLWRKIRKKSEND